MSTSTGIELDTISRVPSSSALVTRASTTEDLLKEQTAEGVEPGTKHKTVEALNSYPDGGWAWLQVFCCSMLFFTTLGGIYSWGVFQDALVTNGLAPASTLSFVGSTQAVLEAVLSVPASRLVACYGPRNMSLIGTFFVGLGPVLAGSVSHSLPGIWMTQGVIFGLGQTLIFFSAATLPSSYFLKKRNLATGLVYAGAGFGGAVFSIVAAALIPKVGIANTFRIIGCLFTAINLPASLVLKSRLPKQPLRSSQPLVEWSLFRDIRFSIVCLATAVALFPLFVPPFFLPLYATSIGLSTSTSSLILAGFNISSAAGRIAFGLGADRYLGSINSLVLCLGFVAISTLAIWPVAETLSVLTLFAVVNGFAAGGFFSLIPGVVSTLFGSSKLSVIFGMLVTMWAPGYFLGAPIGGYILQAYGGPNAGFNAFRPAIFYSGAMSLCAAGLIAAVRFIESKKVWKRV